jgi:acyl transferase domain-containing protein/thioesterase domain-containing protein
MNEPIAIVGLALRAPQASTPDAFWGLLRDGADVVREVPAWRWDAPGLERMLAGVPSAPGVRWGSFIEAVDEFDPEYFGITQREAPAIDPQHRLLLEVAAEALEVAGIAPASLKGTPAGVYVGVSNYDYNRLMAGNRPGIDPYMAIGTTQCIAANRISYWLDLRGPSMAIDAACASSLVAANLAVQALRSGEIDLAIVGGVNLVLSPEVNISFSRAGLMSVDGHCRPFDERASGYVRGEFCGALVLRRLSDARAARNPVLAQLCGTAVNQNGAGNGLISVNGPAQEAVIRAALRNAGIEPSDVGYVEAHGVGSKFGDAIEFNALARALERDGGEAPPCYVGSLKGNLGHPEAASGLASIIKVVLAMRHGEIPAVRDLGAPNPEIGAGRPGLRLVREHMDWPAGGRGRYAGVSAFGMGGTNAHVVLREDDAPAPASAAVPGPFAFVYSARAEATLRALLEQQVSHLRAVRVEPADLAYTLATGRTHHPYRLALVCDSIAELEARLSAHLAGLQPHGISTGKVKKKSRDAAQLEAAADAQRAFWAAAAGAEGAAERAGALQTLAQLHVAGVAVDWTALRCGVERLIPLPTYPFAGGSYWIARSPDAAEATPAGASEAPSRLFAPSASAAAESHGAAPVAANGPASSANGVATSGNGARPPRRDGTVEQRVAAIVAQAVGVATVDADTDLVDLGLDSLIALQVVAEIKRSFERELSLAALRELRTVTEIAAALIAPAQRLITPAVVLGQGDPRAPVVFVHPVGGGVTAYEELANRLDRQVLAFEMAAAPAAPYGVAALAERYLGALPPRAAGTPYVLGGWSFGGLVAYEMAQRLSARGETVALVALIDSFVVAGGEPPDEVAIELGFLEEIAALRGRTAVLDAAELRGLDAKARLTLIEAEARRAGILPAAIRSDDFAAAYRLARGNLAAAFAYHPPPNRAERVVLWRAERRRPAFARALPASCAGLPDLGWAAAVGPKLDIVCLPGDHYSLLTAPIVDDLALQLNVSMTAAAGALVLS